MMLNNHMFCANMPWSAISRKFQYALRQFADRRI